MLFPPADFACGEVSRSICDAFLFYKLGSRDSRDHTVHTSSARPSNVLATCFGKLFGRIFGRNCFGFSSFFRHFGRNNLFWQKENCFGRKTTVSAERILFRQKQLFWQRHFISAETAYFGRNRVFRQNKFISASFGRIFRGMLQRRNAETAKSLFRSDTTNINLKTGPSH